MPQTTVLLGAGASVDAGLPIATSLTRKIAEAIQDDWRYEHWGVAATLNRVIGSIIAHETARGASPYDGVDVERVFSAVKMLSERESLEISPFVAAWNDESVRDSDELPSFWAKNFKEALTTHFDSRLERSFREGVESLTRRGPKPHEFLRVMEAMLSKLDSILSPGTDDAFDYLSPIFTLANTVSVATLNYDLGVETAAARAGISVDRGIELWTGGFDWSWGIHPGLRLLKIHGSLDWTLPAPDYLPRSKPLPQSPPRIGLRRLGTQSTDEAPAIIFGARDKLQAEGPFLAMLQEFSRWLGGTEELIVVGYSFRDAHINITIRDWLQSEPNGNRQLTIIDPTFPVSSGSMSEPNFRDWLVSLAYERNVEVAGPGQQAKFVSVQRPGFRILREGAASGLLKACSPTLDLN